MNKISERINDFLSSTSKCLHSKKSSKVLVFNAQEHDVWFKIGLTLDSTNQSLHLRIMFIFVTKPCLKDANNVFTKILEKKNVFTLVGNLNRYFFSFKAIIWDLYFIFTWISRNKSELSKHRAMIYTCLEISAEKTTFKLSVAEDNFFSQTKFYFWKLILMVCIWKRIHSIYTLYYDYVFWYILH